MLQQSTLNFEVASGVIEKSDESQGAFVVPETSAAGLSVVIAVTFAVVTVWIARTLAATKPDTSQMRFFALPWHVLSFLVVSFLGLNVFFGGLTAILMNQNTEDSKAYFADISILKLSRLSHEHFFGYAVSFGIIAALAFIFIGATKKRVLVPVIGMFLFAGLDVVSWWLTHHLSYGFHTLSYITGGVFASCFLVLYGQIALKNFSAFKISNKFLNKLE